VSVKSITVESKNVSEDRYNSKRILMTKQKYKETKEAKSQKKIYGAEYFGLENKPSVAVA